MRRLLIAVLLLPLLAAPGPASDGAIHVNVVSAGDRGCSPDTFTGPDLRVTVTVDGQIVLETVKAQDTREPLFAAVAAFPPPGRAVEVGIEVHEAEPGGFLGLGTSWVQCDAAPGAAVRHTSTWSDGTVTIVARGDAANAAETVVVVGTDAPARPVVRVTPGTTDATVHWDADASGRATGHRVQWGDHGRIAAEAAAAAGSVRLADLCDDTEYRLRVVRDALPWRVGSDVVVFRTTNAPPQPPVVLEARANGSAVEVRWEARTTHDVRLHEVHAGSAGFTVSAASRRTTVEAGPAAVATQTASFTRGEDDTHVVVRAVDAGGLHADSEPRAVGAAAREASASVPPVGCGPGAGAAPAPSDAADAPAPGDADGRRSDPPPTTIARDAPSPTMPAWAWVVVVAALALGAFGIGLAAARRK